VNTSSEQRDAAIAKVMKVAWGYVTEDCAHPRLCDTCEHSGSCGVEDLSRAVREYNACTGRAT